MSQQVKWAFARRAAVLLLIAITVGFAAGCRSPKGHRFLVPDGYVGWIRVDFGVAGAPALIEEEGFQVIDVPENGVVRTSASMRTSPKRDEVFLKSPRGRVSAGGFQSAFTSEEMESVHNGEGRVSLYLFFGPSKAWDEVARVLPPSEKPIPGWIREDGGLSDPKSPHQE